MWVPQEFKERRSKRERWQREKERKKERKEKRLGLAGSGFHLPCPKVSLFLFFSLPFFPSFFDLLSLKSFQPSLNSTYSSFNYLALLNYFPSPATFLSHQSQLHCIITIKHSVTKGPLVPIHRLSIQVPLNSTFLFLSSEEGQIPTGRNA